MTTSTWAFGKANVSGSLETLVAVKIIPRPITIRHYSTAPAPAPAPVPQTNGDSAGPADQRKTALKRELFMNVLNAHATKRDAKQYLARFKSAKKSAVGEASNKLTALQQERNARHRQDQDRLDRMGVNLGGLYAPARAIAESPQFVRRHVDEAAPAPTEGKIHVALVCLRHPETLDDATLDGLALTLSQLVSLDMRIVVVLDTSSTASVTTSLQELRHLTVVQAERLSRAMAKHSQPGARLVSGALELNGEAKTHAGHASGSGQSISVGLPKLLLEPLKRSVIPIVPCLAYAATGKLTPVAASSVMAGLTALLSGLPINDTAASNEIEPLVTSLDRVIVLDSIGGVPSKARADSAHVFINLEQEYDDIETELADYGQSTSQSEGKSTVPLVYDQHRANLSMVKACLALLPSASSALIITPQEAASASQTTGDITIGTGTRRRKNTLIHNLLTNKPMISSSLPSGRLPSTSINEPTDVTLPRATLIKRGMPVTIIPAVPDAQGWGVPDHGRTTLDLETDPRVDLPRLVHLIEDSFRRKLDVQHYLSRIHGRTAGLIVAGEYEGGAILTWETPPGAPPNDPTRLVPYLDKFAVLSSSQGSSGVADIVFQAMVRTCFPDGVVWRSRSDNPVNKWYFERSVGTWRMPDSGWMMFWTGRGVVEEGSQKWEDYVGVCRSIGPSWADGKKILD